MDQDDIEKFVGHEQHDTVKQHNVIPANITKLCEHIQLYVWVYQKCVLIMYKILRNYFILLTPC